MRCGDIHKYTVYIKEGASEITRQGIMGKWPKKLPCHGKHREFGNFAKTQGILICCSNYNFPDFKGKGYCDSCHENFNFFSRRWIGLPSQFCVCNWHKLCKLAQGKLGVRQGKQGKHREF